MYDCLKRGLANAGLQNSYPAETVAVVSLLHDICKVNFYKKGFRNVKDEETGQWYKKEVYEIDEKFPCGEHADKSVILIQNFMHLEPEEILAIRAHMGGWDTAVKGGNAFIGKIFERVSLLSCCILPIWKLLIFAANKRKEGYLCQSRQATFIKKLAKVRKQVEVIRKNKSGYGYKYVTEDEILAKISVFMDKYHLSLVPSIQPGTTRVEPYTYKKTKTTGKGEFYEENNNEILVSADMVWSWVNNDNPEERIDVSWALVGQQGDASQAFGSGLTYSSRYFLLKYFNIATPDDDPDNFRSKQRAAEAAEDKMIAEGIIQSFDETVKHFLESNKDKAEDVKKFVSKYAKGGNYFAITESALAGKLLAEFKETFSIKEE